MKGKSILEDPKALGNCVETAVFTHLFGHQTFGFTRFSYWKDRKNKELDLVIEHAETLTALEVKYQSKITTMETIPGLVNFCSEKQNVKAAYILTKNAHDNGPIETSLGVPFLRIAACLFCYWVGESKLSGRNLFSNN